MLLATYGLIRGVENFSTEGLSLILRHMFARGWIVLPIRYNAAPALGKPTVTEADCAIGMHTPSRLMPEFR